MSGAKESIAKGIAIVPLRAPATGKSLADAPLALAGIEHPGAGLPGRLVAQVLGMTAGQIHHPVAVLVLMETLDAADPFVRLAFAFGRCVGYTWPFILLMQKVLPPC